MQKIAVFGSAFNPPSLGHKNVIESLSHFDRVLLVPAKAHAWGKSMLDYSVRCTMVERFISDLDINNVELSRLEESIQKETEAITTWALLNRIQELNPNADITFVVGPDNLLNFGKFYQSDRICEQYSILMCPEKVKVRSTKIRENLENGSEIDDLTTNSVKKYLIEQGLYSRIAFD